jgi:hypothetical protein
LLYVEIGNASISVHEEEHGGSDLVGLMLN